MTIRFKRSFTHFAALALLACSEGTTPTPVVSEAEADIPAVATLTDAQCAPVTWHGKALAEPGVFTVSVTINGDPFEMQLDTGADFGGLSGSEAQWPGLSFSTREGWTNLIADGADLILAGQSLRTENLVLYGDEQDPAVHGGTIGFDNLRGHIWLLSQSTDRFCRLDPDDTRLSGAAFLDTPILQNKQMMPLSIDGVPVEGFFFDTGALFSVTSPERWSNLVDEAVEATELEVPSWGNMITIIGKPLKETLVIGDERIEGAVIFQDADRMFFGNDDTPEGMVGLIGMNIFASRDIVLDLRDGRERFGVLP